VLRRHACSVVEARRHAAVGRDNGAVEVTGTVRAEGDSTSRTLGVDAPLPLVFDRSPHSSSSNRMQNRGAISMRCRRERAVTAFVLQILAHAQEVVDGAKLIGIGAGRRSKPTGHG